MPTLAATATAAATSMHAAASPTVDTDRKKSAAVALYGQGWGAAEIAEVVGVSRWTVYRWIREVAEAVQELASRG